MEDDLHLKMTLKYDKLYISETTGRILLEFENEAIGIRQPQILKVEYLSNHWSDLTLILNLTVWKPSMEDKSFKWRWHPMEEDLKY